MVALVIYFKCQILRTRGVVARGLGFALGLASALDVRAEIRALALATSAHVLHRGLVRIVA